MSTIQIWIPTNSNDDYDMNRRSQFWYKFDLFFIKVDHFQSLLIINWLKDQKTWLKDQKTWLKDQNNQLKDQKNKFI